MSVLPIQENKDFDPLSALFVAQAAKPHEIHEINLRTLNPLQRALLVIDGTVTKFIEAYTMEPVEIRRLAQKTLPLTADHVWLEAPKGTPVVARQVLLQGKYSHTLYAFAVSLIVPDRLPNNIKQELEIDGEGLGQILANSRMESYRDILWYGKEISKGLPDVISHMEGKEFISRTYRIINGGKPIMVINEKFPQVSDWMPSLD